MQGVGAYAVSVDVVAATVVINSNLECLESAILRKSTLRGKTKSNKIDTVAAASAAASVAAAVSGAASYAATARSVVI